MSLNYFFKPKAVAIVGASNNPAKLGRQILDNVIKGGFKGKIYPVNLKEKKIAGLKAYASLSDLPLKNRSALLAVIAIPAPFVLDEIKKCVKLGIKNIIIISAGFKDCLGARLTVRSHPYGSADAKPAKRVFACLRILDRLFNVFYRDEALEVVIIINHQQFFYAIFMQQLFGIFQADACWRRDQPVFGHH